MDWRKYLSVGTIVLSASLSVGSICNLVYRDYILANDPQLIKHNRLNKEIYQTGSFGESIDLQKKNPEAWNNLISNYHDFHSLTNDPNFRNMLSLRKDRDLNYGGMFPNLGIFGGALGAIAGYTLLRKDNGQPKS